MTQWIHFIGGKTTVGKLVAIAIGMSADPEHQLATLVNTQPFQCSLMGLEKGSPERLEAIRERFQQFRLNGPWFRAEMPLRAYVDVLEPVDRLAGKGRRVSLDLTAVDFIELEGLVTESGATTKQRYIRRALASYAKIIRFAGQGYAIQAIKDGALIQFEDVANIPDPP